MKKTIITCLGVSSIALTGVFYADQASSRKHTSPANTQPAAAALPGAPLSSDGAPEQKKGTTAQSTAASGSGTPPAQAPEPLQDPGQTSTRAAPAAQNIPPSRQQAPASSSSAASGPAGPANPIVQLLQSADMGNPEEREKVVAEMTRLEESRMDAVLEKAGQLGVPVRIEENGGKVSILHDFRGEQPLYRVTNNKNAAISTGANLIQAAPYGLDGTGVKVGVWDAGSIRSTHRELTARIANKNATAPLDDHSTHVAGTIAASGVDANAKGMAPKSTVDSYDWENDYAEMTASGAATATALAAVPLSNHSYGYGATTADMGRYEREAQTTDALAWSLPYYLPFWAAGNEQDSLTALGGFQSITFKSLAKNIVTIGAVNDAVVAGVRSPSAGAMSTFSSWGPCDDGRIKPDLVANGVSVYSTTAASDSSYDGTYSGTSMATPNAAGSAALIQQLYANTFGQRPRASLLKALLIHTADDLGNPGPDYKFGWGLINVKAAADLVLAQKANPAVPRILENTLTAAVKSTTTTFTWDGSSPIRATLSWTDPAGAAQTAADSRTPNLVHDLDLKITGPDGATVYLPFVMPFVGAWTSAAMSAAATTGKNRVDNTEQVYISNPNRAGTYTVTVSMDAALTTNAQPYALVITGAAASTTPTPSPTPTPTPSPTPAPVNPAPTVALTSPTGGTSISLGSQITLTANASDRTSTGAVGVVSRVEFFSGSASLGIDTAAPYSIAWKPATAGNYILTARATDSQGAVGTSSAVTVSVLAPLPPPTISSFSPASGPVGTSVLINGTNLSAATGVQFNGVTASVWRIVSATQISATVPLGAATGPVRISTATASATSSTAFTVTTPPAAVVISQIYAGGGRWWSDFSNDYVEIHNPGTSPAQLDGWSLQLTGGAGTQWTVVPLKGTIPARGYYLIALAGGDYAYDLPRADATGSYALAAKQGKVALMRTTVPLAMASPLGLPSLSDLVGYGSANAYEGAYPAIAPERFYAIFRSSDTNDNYQDFDWDYAAPRNSATPVTLRKKQLVPKPRR
ncbi:MAG: S8 family serine peptidase [Spartobacteria bacterium]